jgi:hypothetical protein
VFFSLLVFLQPEIGSAAPFRCASLAKAINPLNLIKQRNPFPKLGSRLLFEQKNPQKALIKYIVALDFADTEDVDPISRPDFLWIIRNLPELLDPEKSFENYKKPASDVTIDDAFEMLAENKMELLKQVRRNPNLKITPLWLEAGWRRIKKPALFVMLPITVFSLSGWFQSYFSGFWERANALGRQRSYIQTYNYLYGGKGPLPYVSPKLHRMYKEAITRTNATLDPLEQPARDDFIYYSSAIANIEGRIDASTKNNDDQALDDWMLILYCTYIRSQDVLGSDMGIPIRIRVEHIFETYDGHQDYRQKFEKLYNSKN